MKLSYRKNCLFVSPVNTSHYKLPKGIYSNHLWKSSLQNLSHIKPETYLRTDLHQNKIKNNKSHAGKRQCNTNEGDSLSVALLPVARTQVTQNLFRI